MNLKRYKSIRNACDILSLSQYSEKISINIMSIVQMNQFTLHQADVISKIDEIIR